MQNFETGIQLRDKIATRTARVGVVGMGYVGLPFSVEKAQVGFSVFGIDRNSRATSSPAKILNSAGLKDATFGLDKRRTYKSGDPRLDGVQIDAIHVRDAYLENVTLLETVGLTDHRAWRAKLVVPTPV